MKIGTTGLSPGEARAGRRDCQRHFPFEPLQTSQLAFDAAAVDTALRRNVTPWPLSISIHRSATR
jgi:hypothetical protein